ncbi:tetratricopeptide repeat protein [bacterium]|nr:tetratricopeptide repeat protein [Flavobacteriaceae bacterium]MDB0041162.1 tetratricopeptide repeat protein [bacterium]MDB4005904.1 tetratricopeptide repeat protein [Flavobacteriaceae bacterium]MDB9902031.1 tetratricopeptide repeat protein [Flavobacteriaceae bacterium]MDC0593265.1 tetratricopeptide repeat protein [Flavobacteriaceae bacterium]
MKKIITLLLLILISFFGNSQTLSEETSVLLDSLNKYKFINYNKALNYGLRALDINDPKEISINIFDINAGLGEILFYQNNYAKSIEYFLTALNMHNLLPVKDRRHKYVNEPPWILVALGNLYYKIERFEIAKEKYLEAIDNFNLIEDEFLTVKINGLSTSKTNIALIYSTLGDFQKAESQYKDVIELRKKAGYEATVIYQYMEIMQFYYKYNMTEKGDDLYELATILYKESIDVKKGNSLEEIKIWYAYVLTVYGSNLLKLKKIKQALISLNESKKLINAQNHNTTVYPDVNLEIAKCYYELQSYNKAENALLESLSSDNLISEPKPINFNSDKRRLEKLLFLSKIYTIQGKKTEIIKIKDSIIKTYQKQDDLDFNIIENRLVLYEKEKEINKNKLEKTRLTYTTYIGLLIFIIIIIAFFSRFKFQRERNSRLELEKNEVSLKLESKNIELVSKANFILQRNEYLKNIISKLNKSEVNEQSFRRVKKEVSELINSQKSYEEFDKIFTNVYPKFYKILNDKHNLSQTYLRLAAYIRMRQSNNEIAKICGVSIRTVETQRYRLSKLLKLEKNENLNSYIQRIN